jgi:glycerol-3-phosphate dehydrogenase
VPKPSPPRGRFSAHTRADNVQRFQREKFDIAIVGGGITGAGIARDAALRGLSVALLEKGDFGSGTSSKSSRMIHGGLRYLRQRHVSLVRESLRERGVLIKIAPHLVHPFPFLLPVYGSGLEERLQLKVGLTAYDLLAGRLRLERHRMLSSREVLREEPALRSDGLQGALRYFDCLVHDARLTLATARSAARQGAAVANYVQATALEREEQRPDGRPSGRVVGVRFRDLLSGRTGVLRARVVVNAAGPWCDELRAMTSLPPMLRPTKGIHVVVPHQRLPVTDIVIFFHNDRSLFAVPKEGWTYIGTTDTDYRGDPGQARADATDVAYVLEAANTAFPGLTIVPGDIVSCWAGVRPLVAEEGAPTPSDVSRDYEIKNELPGLVSIAGGKLTTYRSMAQDLLDRLVAGEGRRVDWSPRPCCTADLSLPGGDFQDFESYSEGAVAALEEGWGLSPAVASRLVRTYGTEHVKILAYGLRDKRLLEPLTSRIPVLRAEVLYAVEEEMAVTLEDFLDRRADLMLFDPSGKKGLDAAPPAARLMGSVLGWGWRARREQLRRYREAVAAMMAFANKKGTD